MKTISFQEILECKQLLLRFGLPWFFLKHFFDATLQKLQQVLLVAFVYEKLR